MTVVASWLLTYLLHSSLLLGGVAVVCAVLRGRRLALQEALLRAGLVGGFLTTGLQVGLGLQPLGGVLTLPKDVAATVRLRGEGPAETTRWAAVGAEVDLASMARGSGGRAEEVSDVASASGARSPLASLWKPTFVGLWVALAVLGLARMAVAAVRLRRLLRPRRPVLGDELAVRAQAVAAGLGLRRPIPMSAVPQLQVPLAAGLLRPEVYLPARALRELAAEQQVALCAHELAHVARRDPAWILLARAAEALAPIQPLNGWGRRRLQDLAECLADDLAVAASGGRVGLARSLVDVASWTVVEPFLLPAAVSGAMSTRSRLAHRVERLMDPLRSLERPRRLLLPLAGAAVLATVLVTPVVSGQQPVEETPPEEALAPSSPPAAPLAVESDASDAAAALEEQTQAIADRADSHGPAIAELEAEVRALVEGLPEQAELARLGAEVETAALGLEKAQREGTPADVDAAQRELEVAQEKIQEVARGIRIPEEQLRLVQERAREVAESVAPTAEEAEEIRRLALEAARESTKGLAELQQEMAQLSRELQHDGLLRAREAMLEAQRAIHEALAESLPEIREAARIAGEAARQAGQEARAASAEAREAARHAREAAREEREMARQAREKAREEREAAREEREKAREEREKAREEREAAREERERTRSLEEVEEPPLEETAEEEPGIEQP